MKIGFLQSYASSYQSIPGYFSLDAALMFLAYNQLAAAEGISGDALEIGVHHGRSAIILAAMRGPRRQFVAVDLFEQLQDQNLSGSGAGNERGFIRNMKTFFGDLSFLKTIKGNSSMLSPLEIGAQFSFCHVDGGHTPQETFGDLALCTRVLLPGGLLALDDYFNPAFPGVSEGAVQFSLEHGETLKPIAIGFNKVLFQRTGANSKIESQFKSTFPMIPSEQAVLWGTPVSHFTTSLRPFFDLSKSSAQCLVEKKEGVVVALLEPRVVSCSAKAGQKFELDVTVTNTSDEAFPHGHSTFGLSYHLRSADGEIVKFDNARAYFESPLQPQQQLTATLLVEAPDVTGLYIVELDLVWEGMFWFKENGNPTKTVELLVKE